MGIIVHTSNPLAPLNDRKIEVIEHRPTIAEWLSESGVEFNVPTICLHNGDAVLRQDWQSRVINDGDIVVFMALPQGGRGGSGVLQIVMMLAVVVFAAWAGPALAGALGATSAAAGMAATGVIMAAGNMLISMLMPPANPLSSLRNNELAAPSPTYSIGAQGNSARLGASIPVIYGKHRVYPDFAAQPYAEFVNNEQYLYQLFCIGQGEYDILDMRIEDSPTSSFEEISYTVYGPNQNVTAFPTRVENSGEVAGQELLHNEYIGYFFANAEDTTINQIAIDIVAPSGMYYANDAGGLDQRSASFVVEAAKWNETFETLGTFLNVISETITAASASAIRRTYKVALEPGRYAVRVKRTNAKDASSRASNSIVWAGMRGYVPGEQNYGGVTIVAMTMKATNNLSQASSRRVNCLVQRKLKTWHPVDGWSSGTIATRSIAWAIADIAKAEYGLKLRDSQIDLPGIYALEQVYNSRAAAFGAENGDYCDIVFDNRVSALEAMANVGQCGRAMPIVQGALLRIVRDTPQAIPTALFSARNIVKGSFNIRYVMPNEYSADSVIVEYVDKNTLMPKEAEAILPGSTSANPARLKMQGISSHQQAWREAVTQAAANRYRRKLITFQTELEGHIPTVGDLIAISHPMPSWGLSGEVTEVSGLNLTLSEPPIFEAGQTHYIALRKADGGVAGPFVCTAHISNDPYRVTIAAGVELGFTVSAGDDKERTHFAFGKAGEVFTLARVLPPIRPRGLNLVEISCTNESQLVHEAESGTLPPLPEPWQLPYKITKPAISRLDVSQGGTSSSPILLLSWSPAAGADHYIIQTSGNNADWISHPETSSTSASINVEPGPVWVRVAAVGLARGNWASWNGEAGQIPPPGNVTGLASIEAFTGSRARINWNPVKRADRYLVEVWALGVLRRSSSTGSTEYTYNAEDVKRDGGPWRALTFKVAAANELGESSEKAEITLTNPQVGSLSGVNIYAGIRSVVITYSRPTDLDFEGVLVFMGATPGFTPDEENKVYEGGDRVIVVPGLLEGLTYYFRLAAFDSFGKDSLTYTGEYSAFISSANTPSPEEIKQGLQQALIDSQNPLVFNADAFAVRINDTDKTPFIIGLINGNPAILLDADVGISGSLSADKIRSGRIAATENITIGNGGAVINGNGSIIVYDGTDTAENRNFAMLSAGTLTFQRYKDGAYHEYKSVRRVEYGQANSGQTVTLPGYWESQPRLIVSPASLRSYDASQNYASQTWTIRAEGLREEPVGSCVWRFEAIAELNYSSSAGSNTVALTTSGSADSWASGESILPSNTASVTVAAQFKSIKGNGTSTFGYFFRTVTWTIQGFNGVGWVNLATKARDISQAEHNLLITDSQSANVTGYSRLRLSFVATNTNGGIYYLGGQSDQYNYASNDVSLNPTHQGARSDPGGGSDVNGVDFYTAKAGRPATKVCAMNAYAAPAGWENYFTEYYFEYARKGSSPAFSGGIYGWYGTASIPNLSWSNFYDAGTTFTATSFGEAAAYNQNRIVCNADIGALWGPQPAFSTGRYAAETRNRWARAYLRQKILNSSASSNTFTFQSYSWNISGSSAIALGSLNWTAIGE